MQDITFTVTIPARFVAVLAGLGAGAALIALYAAGVELWTPFMLVPAYWRPQAAPARAEPPEPVETRTPREIQAQHVLADLAIERPAAILEFRRAPLPVQIALDNMVDRVLAERYGRAA